jgi:hypothetical protein
MSQRYKGCWIDPRAFELRDGSGWTAEVYVAEDIGAETVETQFLLRGIFATREAALEAALAVGKRQVDKGIDHEIGRAFEEETKLPSTYRRGLGRETDDVAEGPSGEPTKVWGPENPEDRYE